MGDGAKAAWAAEQTAGWTTAWMTKQAGDGMTKQAGDGMTKRMEERTNWTLDGGAM